MHGSFETMVPYCQSMEMVHIMVYYLERKLVRVSVNLTPEI